jgi:shikimate dehydrogenase
LGDPVAHSISPQIHNHAFAKLGLPYAYVPLRVSAAQIETAVRSLHAFSFAGANVTIPHKQAVVPLCGRLSALSALIGAVNTLYFNGDALCGDTTDAEGFFRALAWMGHDPARGQVVILGNGGTARTLAFALALGRIPAALTLVGREQSKVAAVAQEVSARTGFAAGAMLFTSPQLKPLLERCSLLINCTSVGMHPNADASPLPRELLHQGMTVFDTIYNPATTLLLRWAKEASCATQNGLRMLLYQGLASSKLWTGVEVPETIFDIHKLERLVASR